MTQQDDITQPVLTEPGIQALWDEACKDSPKNPGWNRHIRFARAIEQALSKLRAPVADSTLPLEKALHELVSKIAPGLDTGDLLQDAQRASAMLDAIQASAPVADEHCSACNPQVFSVEQLEKDPLLVARLWHKPADTDGSLVERILEHVSEYGESMASSSLLSVRKIARRNLEVRIEAELADAMRSQDESPLREALSEIASAWSARTRLPEEDGIQALKDIARAALASAPVAGEQIIAWDVQDTGLGRRYTTYNPKVAEDLMNLGENVRPLVYASALPPANAAPQASAEPRQYTHAEVFGLMESAWNAALEEAAQTAYKALFPTNDRSDWTEFAESAAYHAELATQCIRALKQPQAEKDGCTCPSGDGSLRHPCPMHPGAHKDGGQQRAGDNCKHARAYRAVDRMGYHCPDCGEFVSDYEIHRRQRAALSATQPEQGERDE